MFQLPEVHEILKLRTAYEAAKDAFLVRVVTAYNDNRKSREQLINWLELCVTDDRLMAEIVTHVEHMATARSETQTSEDKGTAHGTNHHRSA